MGDSELTIGKPGDPPRSVVRFEGESVNQVAMAPDESRMLVALTTLTDAVRELPRAVRFELIDLEGRRTPIDLPDGTAHQSPSWSPDSSRIFLATGGIGDGGPTDATDGAIVASDGRVLSRIADADIALWSADSHQLAVAGPAGRRVRMLDADGSLLQAVDLATAGRIDQLVWLP